MNLSLFEYDFMSAKLINKSESKCFFMSFSLFNLLTQGKYACFLLFLQLGRRNIY